MRTAVDSPAGSGGAGDPVWLASDPAVRDHPRGDERPAAISDSVAGLENTEDSQSNNVQDAEEEQEVEFRFNLFSTVILPGVLPSLAGYIGGRWFVAQIENPTIGLVACGLAFVICVLATMIACLTHAVTLNRIAVGVFVGTLIFFGTTLVFLGYPWLSLLTMILWLAIAALVVHYGEKSRSPQL